MKEKPGFVVALGGMAGLLVGFGCLLGVFMAAQFDSLQLILPETALYATAATGAETLAAATGPIDDDIEGLFYLDFLTGELGCQVLNARGGTFNSAFRTNVIKDLGVSNKQKTPKYLLLTGLARFPRGASLARPSLSVIYVVDANTGNFAAYSVPWRVDFSKSGRPQVGQFTLLGDCRKGRRPSFVAAAGPEEAERLCEAFVRVARELGAEVACGRFRAHMRVSLINDGPVTLMLDSHKLF